jgi:chemotaxis signal transduction protein
MLPEVTVTSQQLISGYAFLLAGVPVFLPATVFMEYVASVQAQPVPRAAPRVLGLIQRRGTILPVFDPQLHRHPRPQGKAVSVLVIGEGAQAGAVLIEGQPQLLHVHTHSPDDDLAVPESHSCVFSNALSVSCSPESEFGNSFWFLDPEALFLSLSKSGYSS